MIIFLDRKLFELRGDIVAKFHSTSTTTAVDERCINRKAREDRTKRERERDVSDHSERWWVAKLKSIGEQFFRDDNFWGSNRYIGEMGRLRGHERAGISKRRVLAFTRGFAVLRFCTTGMILVSREIAYRRESESSLTRAFAPAHYD